MGSSAPVPIPAALRRVCVVCAARPGGLVAFDCPLCEGAGMVALGPFAAGRDPVVVGVVVAEAMAEAVALVEAGAGDGIAADVGEWLVVEGIVRRLPETLRATRPLAPIDLGDEVAAARARRGGRRVSDG